jgi:four helix bundle protein
MELAMLIYSVTAEFPNSEMYGLTSQMRRAAVSIASNIAEGTARGTRKDFRQFVIVARGSNCELQTQILLAQRLADAEELAAGVGQMLSGLSKYLSSSRNATGPRET